MGEIKMDLRKMPHNIAWYGLWERLQILNRRVARTRTPL